MEDRKGARTPHVDIIIIERLPACLKDVGLMCKCVSIKDCIGEVCWAVKRCRYAVVGLRAQRQRRGSYMEGEKR